MGARGKADKAAMILYLQSLPDQSTKCVTIGESMYSPKDLAREVRLGTDFGKELIDLFMRVLKLPAGKA